MLHKENTVLRNPDQRLLNALLIPQIYNLYLYYASKLLNYFKEKSPEKNSGLIQSISIPINNIA